MIRIFNKFSSLFQTKKNFYLFIFLVVLVLKSSQVFSADLSRYNMIGLKGGVWRVDKAKDMISTSVYKASSNTYSPYLELYFSLGLKKGFCLEFLLGSCSRGETRFDVPDGYFWESITIVPLSFGAKHFFFSKNPKRKWKPYTDLGLSYVIGSSKLDYGSFGSGEKYFFEGFGKSRSTFGLFLGGGLDYSLSELLWVNFDLKYQWIKFGKEVGGLKDYGGTRLTLGLSYVIKQK